MQHWCKSAPAAASMLRRVVLRLNQTWPGLQEELLKEAPGEGLLLRCLGELRQQCANKGSLNVSLEALDSAVSVGGSRSRQYLASHNYVVGKRAWKSMLGKQQTQQTRQKRGRPSKVTPNTLALARGALDEHAKPGSLPAHVRVLSDGSGYGPAQSRGARSDVKMVPSQSLLANPTQIYAGNTELRKAMSLSTFRKMVKERFAEYRAGLE